MSAVQDILSNYQHVVSDLKIVTGDSGVFDLEVDGKLVYSKAETECFPNEGEVLEIMTKCVGEDVPRYGT